MALDKRGRLFFAQVERLYGFAYACSLYQRVAANHPDARTMLQSAIMAVQRANINQVIKPLSQ